MPSPEQALPLSTPDAPTTTEGTLTVAAVREAAIATGIDPDEFVTPSSPAENAGQELSSDERPSFAAVAVNEGSDASHYRSLTDLGLEDLSFHALKPLHPPQPDKLAALMDKATKEPYTTHNGGPSISLAEIAAALALQKRQPVPTKALPLNEIAQQAGDSTPTEAISTRAPADPQTMLRALGDHIDADPDARARFTAARLAEIAAARQRRTDRGEARIGSLTTAGSVAVSGLRRAGRWMRTRHVAAKRIAKNAAEAAAPYFS